MNYKDTKIDMALSINEMIMLDDWLRERRRNIESGRHPVSAFDGVTKELALIVSLEERLRSTAKAAIIRIQVECEHKNAQSSFAGVYCPDCGSEKNVEITEAE